MSTFGSLNTAATGLSAAQRSMSVTGQNIVNANTPGYSRQKVLLSSAGAATSAAFFSGQQESAGGVGVADVARVRDAFLESSRAAAGARREMLVAQATALSGAEQLLAEPGDTGLQRTLDVFFAGWADLANNPSDTAAGAVVIERGRSVTEQLRTVASGLAGQWSISRVNLQDVLAQVNQTASDLANLNARIQEGTVAGNTVNELLDSRDILVRRLADLAGGAAQPMEDGQVQVSVGGVTIVAGARAQTLTLGGAPDVTGALADPPTVYWGTTAVNIESGEALGLLAALRTDLPNLLAGVDGVATSLRDAVNSLHTSGFTLAGAAGGDFFDGADALTIGVVPTVFGDLAVTPTAGTVDGANAGLIADLADESYAQSILGGQGPLARWRDLTTGLGVQLKSITTAADVQSTVVQHADDALESNAGVSLDEEMSNLIMFQRSYQASARVISTIDDMLDTLINRMGR